MIGLAWATWSVAVATLLGLAAAGAERVLRAAGRPGRWPWAAALAGTWVLALVALLAPPAPTTGADLGALVLVTEAEASAAEPALVDGLAWLPAPVADLARRAIPAARTALADATATLNARLTPLVAPADGWFLPLWAGASVLGLLLVGLSLTRLLRRVRRWPEAWLSDEPVRLSPDFGPALVGLARPRIVLPRWVLRLGPAAVGLAVAHEREHRRAGDALLLAAGALAVLAAPWNPALWWQLRRLRLGVELDCDRRVLGTGASPSDYGALLLRVGEHVGRVGVPALALAERSSFLERRLRMITTAGTNRMTWKSAGAALGALALVVVACETPAPTNVAPPAAPEGVAAVAEVPGEIEVAEVRAERAVDGLSLIVPRPHLLAGGKYVQLPHDALIIIDGVITDRSLTDVSAIPDIQSIEVVKSGAALELYGDRARNGVVLVTTGASLDAAGTFRSTDQAAPTFEERAALDKAMVELKAGRFRFSEVQEGIGSDPLLVVDEVVIDGGLEAVSLDRDGIDRVEVIKGGAALGLYGERAADGVVRITTKRAAGTIRESAGGSAGTTVRGSGGGVIIRRDPSEAPPEQPVIFVDDELFDGDLQDLDTANIESVDVRKGAAAAKLLTERGMTPDGRGVVVVTTKRR